jgi:hypothetical protein
MLRRLPVLIVLVAALAVPAAASGRVVELGAGATPVARPDCPLPQQCQVAVQVTGYQGHAGNRKNPFVVPHSGWIVAFSVSLGKPNARQLQFFRQSFGPAPQVRLSILRAGKRRKTRLDHRLMAQSRPFRVDPYFGSTPTFTLDRPLRVRPKYIVALTVPTWAPVFAPNLTRANWWRSARAKGQCQNVSQHAAQQTVGAVVKYGCTYFTARLLYTATYIPDPTRTDKKRR